MKWYRLIALALAFFLVSAACTSQGGDTDPEEVIEDTVPDEAEFVTVAFGDSNLQVNPKACLEGDPNNEPAEAEQPIDVGIGPSALPSMPPGDSAFLGPVYRPELVLSTPEAEIDPVAFQADLGVLLEPVEFVVDGGEPFVEINGGQVPPTVDVVNQMNGAVGAEEALISVWRIAESDDPALLDPANLALVASQDFGYDVSPVHVLIPAGGHMYGPEGEAAIVPDAETSVDRNLSSASPSVAIIDHSFAELPKVGVHDDTGHGAFIHGIIAEMLPEAEVTTVDMGPGGEVLAPLVEDAAADVYSATFGSSVDPDEIQLLLAVLTLLNFLGVSVDSPLDLAGVNMSFGTYNCDGGVEDLVRPPKGLEAAIRLFQGVDVFAAAGNDGDETPWWPAAFGPSESWIHSIGATDGAGGLAWFSQRGSWVEKCEVGVDVIVRPVVSGTQSTDYYSWSGTSFAAPQALARSAAGLSLTDCPEP